MDKEIWKTIPLGDRKYEASTHGNVRRFYKGDKRQGTVDRYKTIHPTPHKKGYLKLGLGQMKQQYVHRLIALTFLPAVEGKIHVNHKDGDKLNNHVENLEWCTPIENNLHAHQVLGVTKIKPVVLVDRKTREVHREFPSELQALKTMKSLRGYLVVPQELYSPEYANEILDKPRIRVKQEYKYRPSWARKLTDEQVEKIRELCAAGMRDYHVALEVGCKGPTVKGIRTNKIYRTVGNNIQSTYLSNMKKAYTLKIEEDLIEQIKKQAEKENRSASNLIETVMKAYVEDKWLNS
jgi:hypothetical protein